MYLSKKSNIEQEIIFALAQFPCPVTVPEILKVANQNGETKFSQPETEALLGKLCLDGSVNQFEVNRYQCNHIWHSDELGKRICCSRCQRMEKMEEEQPLGVQVIDQEEELKRLQENKHKAVAIEACEHNWEFQELPGDSGFAERCSKCQQVQHIETSDRLEELIAWLNRSQSEFELHAKNTKDDRKRDYYLEYARDKQQLAKQVSQYKAIVLEKEREEILGIEQKLDRIAKRFFVDSGNWYRYIVDKKLYKSLGYKTFEVYCRERRGISRQQAYNLINAAKLIQDLENVNPGLQKIPLTSERQCRIIAKLPEEERADFLIEVAQNNNGKIPSVRQLEKIIKERKKPVEMPVKYQVETLEPTKPKLEIVTKYGKPVKYNIGLTSPEIARAFEKYVEENGIASFDGAIARLLGL